MSGKLRALACTVASWNSTPLDLERLTSHTYGTFSAPEGRSGRYSASALLVRYLIQGADSDVRGVFRDYLREGRDAGVFSFPELLERLGIAADDLASRVSAWAAGELAGVRCS